MDENINDLEHGADGSCCCNCKHQVKIHCHPSNGNIKSFGVLDDILQIGKGKINQQFAWGCIGMNYQEKMKNVVVYHDFEHGMCELYQLK